MNQKDTQTVRFVYATAANGRKTTVAYVYDDADQSLVVAASQCSAKDQFVKRIGREVAFNRLRNDRGVRIGYTAIGSTAYSNVARYIAENIDSVVKNKLYAGVRPQK